MEIYYSFIIPVYNRPEEIDELLASMVQLGTTIPFEVVIVEDGSTEASEEVCQLYADQLSINYYYKPNTGPGDSRNYGMEKAKGNYFLILDSDCILPSSYLTEVNASLKMTYVDCFGGPDNAHESFSNLQKAINHVMTSFLTTGGIRGRESSVNKFQPRSFNMGLSKKAFEATKGFGKIHPGEDPDLTLRLWKKGFDTKLISKAFVYHKRRISWKKFYIQVNKFGKCRPILNEWHPETKKLTYWFPTLFAVGSCVAIVLLLFNIKLPIVLLALYMVLVFIGSVWSNKSVAIGGQTLLALFIQFFGYGYGFLESTIKVNILKKDPRKAFPKLFFD